jgi:paraquat-inducible protein A
MIQVLSPVSESLRACPTCGLIQSVRALEPGEEALCARCDALVCCERNLARGNLASLSAAIAALIIFPLAISLPIMQLERFGHSTEASVWSGSIGLLVEGEIFVGVLVLVCSVILPLVKLGGLVFLCTSERLPSKHRASFYRAIEMSGRWGMLDVLLVAVVVAWVKIGDLVEVTAGPAALAFSVVVVLSLIASARFDPHALWVKDSDSSIDVTS